MDAKELAQIIGNVLGAAEMLTGPYVDAMAVIEKVLAAPELYADFLGPRLTTTAEGAVPPIKIYRPNCF
jgi:hypothetical protein